MNRRQKNVDKSDDFEAFMKQTSNYLPPSKSKDRDPVTDTQTDPDKNPVTNRQIDPDKNPVINTQTKDAQSTVVNTQINEKNKTEINFCGKKDT